MAVLTEMNLQADLEHVKKLFHGDTPVYRTEKLFIKQNNETIWGAVTVSVVHDRNGTFLYYMSMIEDITERKQADEALRDWK